jgi:hypothetical protein
MHAIEIASDKTAVTESVKSLDQQEDHTVNKRSFGILNLWSIRRGARTYRIHNRIPRV